MLLKDRIDAIADTRKNDIGAVLIIFLLPILVNFPTFFGWWSVNPIHFFSGIESFNGEQILRGYPRIDPSSGFVSQALGKEAAQEWLSGRIPWWNDYSGVGRPLAAEMSPGAFFLPFVLLNHFRDGLLYIEAILQILGGLGTYCLLRKMRLTQLAAFTGAILYEFSGTFVWLGMPWTGPIAFLPWIIYGIECVRDNSVKRSSGGWKIVSVSVAFSIYGSFPEVAYIDGLFAAVWSCWRLFELPSESRLRFIRKLATGVVVGLLLSAPLIIPFLEYLSHAYLGGHTFSGGFGGLQIEALPQLFFPCLYGIPWSYHDSANVANLVWGAVGGYLTVAQLAAIVFGLLMRRGSALVIVLLLWALICLGRTFQLPFLSPLVDFVPLVKLVAFYRYAPPTWEFSIAVLCAKVVNDLGSAYPYSPRKLIIGLLVALSILAICLYPAHNLVEQFYAQAGYGWYFWISLAWGFGGMIAVALCFRLAKDRPVIAARAAAAVLAVDAIALFCVPSFSGVMGAQTDSAGVDYLKEHIGTNRFYTLGPIQPNYGDYYGISSINHNALPIAANWAKYITERLDPYAHPVFFTGNFRPDPKAPSAAEVVGKNFKQFEEIGVRYVVSPHLVNPFDRTLEVAVSESTNKPFNLESGQSVDGKTSGSEFTGNKISAVRILIGNYSGASDGKLRVRLSANGSSAVGERSLQESQDNQYFLVTLDRPMTLSTGDFQYEISDIDSTKPVALWIYPQKPGQQSNSSAEIPSGWAPRLVFVLPPEVSGEGPRRVYESSDMDIYELPRPGPYFEIVEGDGDLHMENRASVSVNCSSPARLLRRELYYPGWKARLDGKSLHIEVYDDLFQAIRIPPGQHKIIFSYVPTHIRLITAFFVVGLFSLAVGARRLKIFDRKKGIQAAL
jgi:hypothetical protein